MLKLIIPERQDGTGQFLSIEGENRTDNRTGRLARDRDVVNRLSVTVVDFKGRP